GTFKSMERAKIDPPIFGHSASSQRVACKQVYSKAEGLQVVQQPSLEAQTKELSMDVLCTQWAAALLELCYDFIEEQSEITGDAQFVIPRLRYVRAALAVTASADNGTRPQQVFMLEELIDPKVEGEWRKYINNDSAEPIIQDSRKANEAAEFLAFCQHVQYLKTGKLAFVTDFQGGLSLLSDPQIITHPELGQLFGKGNLGQTHATFELDHSCNKFCQHFGI
ncbi:hypothetical protein DENSPDRAFT_742638, partial [Dentipellis sp. KUC8613]